MVLPAADRMGLGLCVHRPFLSFRHDDLAGVSGRPSHFSYADASGASFGLWDLRGLQLKIDGDPKAGPGLRLEEDFDRLLSFDDLTPGLGEFEGKLLKPAHWRRKVSASLRLGSGTLGSEHIAGHPDPRYDIGPRGSAAPRRVTFRQVALYRYFSDEHVLSIVGRRVKDGGKDVLRFRAGAQLTLTHLCAVGEGDGDSLYEADVLAFYELSKLRVPRRERSVLHPPALSSVGRAARPTSDACPPARAWVRP